MKFATLALATSLALSGTLVFAQTNPAPTNPAPSGGPAAQSTTGDPAASSANSNPTTTGASRSGSGTSTSGGRDANGDQGRDAMPDSSIGVRPLDKQNKH